MRLLKPIRVQMTPLKALSDRHEAIGFVCLVLLGFWCCLSRSSLAVSLFLSVGMEMFISHQCVFKTCYLVFAIKRTHG